MNHRLVIAWTADHARYLHRERQPNDLIISLDLDASALLETYQIPHLEAHHFISAAEVSELQSSAYNLTNNWFKPIEDDCRIDGISPLEIEKRTLYKFFHNALCARLIFMRILECYSIKQFMLFEFERTPATFTALQENASVPIFQYLAEQKSVAIQTITIPKVHETRVPVRRRRNQLKTVYNLIRNRLAWQRHFRYFSRQRSRELFCVVVLVNEGYRLAAVIDGLFGTFGQRMVAAVVGGRSSGGLQLPEYKWSYLSLSLLPDHRYWGLKRQARKWYSRWLSFQEVYAGDLPEIFANRYFDFQFRFYFLTRIPNTVQTYREARTILRRTNVKVLLSTSILDLHLSAVVAAAHTSGIQVITAPHSGMPTEPNLTYFGDTTIGWTKDYVHAWQQVNKTTPVIVAGLHPSIISQGYRQKPFVSNSQSNRKRIVLMLSTVQISAIQFLDTDLHRSTLKTIADVPPHLIDKVEVIFKLHPSYDYKYFYESLIPPQSDAVTVVRDTSLEDVLNSADLAVLVNINTSAHLLSLALEIPTLYIHTANTWLGQYFKLDDWGAEFTVRTDEAIWPTFEKILFDSTSTQKLVEANRKYWTRLEATSHDPVEIISRIVQPHLS